MKAFLAILLLCAASVQAQDHAVDTLKAAKADLFSTIVAAAGATDEFSNPNARVTVLAPSDEAVKAFLKDMGLTAADVKANPTLADALVAYHTVLGVAAGPKELFAKGDTVEIPSADGHYSLTFIKKGNDVLVKDAQGNTAKVSQAGLGKGKHTVHVIDKVLYSGSYFKDLAAVLKAYPSMFSTAGAAATKAGLAAALTKQDFADTLFLPTNAAFTKAKVNVDSTDKAALADVLSYHVVAGAKRIPSGFEAGKKVPTLLKGQDVTVTYKDEEKRGGMPAKRAFVNDAMVIKPNLMISKGVVHVIDAVLMPKPAAAAAPAAVSTEAAKKPEAAATTSGRKLLQRGGGGGGGGAGQSMYGPTIALDSSEQAILQAVNDGARDGSVRTAAQANLANSEVLSQYPEHATYATGLPGSAAALSSGGN